MLALLSIFVKQTWQIRHLLPREVLPHITKPLALRTDRSKNEAGVLSNLAETSTYIRLTCLSMPWQADFSTSVDNCEVYFAARIQAGKYTVLLF